MSLKPDGLEQPPTYEECSSANDLWEPTILVLDGTAIHRESTNSVPLYQLSRAVSVITASTRVVEFQRVEHSIKKSITSEEPAVKPRPRHIYNLKIWRTNRAGRFLASVFKQEAPFVAIQSVSRRTLGHFGVKLSHVLQDNGLKVYPIDISHEHFSWSSSSSNDTRPLLQRQLRDGKIVWMDEDDRMIAMEECEAGQNKLISTASLRRDMVDTLVALWCALIWQYTDQNTEPVKLYKGLDDVRRKMRLVSEVALMGGYFW